MKSEILIFGNAISFFFSPFIAKFSTSRIIWANNLGIAKNTYPTLCNELNLFYWLTVYIFIYIGLLMTWFCVDSRGNPKSWRHLTSTGYRSRSSSPRSPIVRNKVSMNVRERSSSPRSPVVRKKTPASGMFLVSKLNSLINFANFIADLKTKVIFV